jgi:pectinesterase
VHDLYLVFSGTTSDYLLNINHFTFTASGSRVETTAETSDLNDNRIRIFPSPANEEMTIDIGGVLDKKARYLIYDNLGRQVLASTVKGNISRINVGSLSPGVYTMRLFNGKELITKKFLKK